MFIFKYIDSASELAWDTPEESSELLSTMPEEDEEENEKSDDESAKKPVSNIEAMAPYSTISEVTLNLDT